MRESIKITVWLEPCGHSAKMPYGDPNLDSSDWRIYKVVKLRNSTSPDIGKVLSKAQVDDMIREGFTVEIK